MTGATVRRREDGATELRVNGVFVMDDVETTSEERLGHAVLELGAKEIFVGGLGLGHTLRTLLASPDVRRVIVAELHEEIVGWMRDGTIPGAGLLSDPRVEVVIDDVRAVVATQPQASLDAIVLDVDNGPDFLVHDANAEVYEAAFLTTCAERLRPGGTVCIWSMRESSQLTTAMRLVFASVVEESIPVRLQGREEQYWIFIGTRQGTVSADG